MAKLPHCIDCGCEINKKIDVKVGNRWRCQNCNERMEKIKKHREELYEYICNLYNIKFPTGLILKQIQEYKIEYDYKYWGMLLTLKYFYEVLEKPVKYDDGVGIIPYIYEEAKKYYFDQQKIRDKAKNIKELTKNKSIVVKKDKNNNSYNNFKTIDISKIK